MKQALGILSLGLFFAGVCIMPSFAQEPAAGKTLLLYYSKTGNTQAACDALQKALGIDIKEIKDLNSRNTKLGGIGGMLKTLLGKHTAIEPKKVDLAPYTTIIISAPIWAAKFGLAMRTFVETNRFDGKNVIIFITSDSFIEDKYQEKHRQLVKDSGGTVAGYFQVQATDLVNGEKVPRSKDAIVQETLKLVPGMQKAIAGR
jgi:flavodoxin